MLLYLAGWPGLISLMLSRKKWSLKSRIYYTGWSELRGRFAQPTSMVDC